VEKKGDEKRVEAEKPPKVPKNERRGMLYKYPSQNATSRRRNFTGKKLDVYGDLEQKAKNLSAAFCNEFTRKNTEIRSGFRYFEKEIDPFDYKFPPRKVDGIDPFDYKFPPRKVDTIDPFDYKFPPRKVDAPKNQTLLSEPSMVDLVTCGTSYYDCQEKSTEKMEHEKKEVEDKSTNKVVELKEDDQKKLMDLGICEMESNKRLESLIARRRARKLLKLEIENGLIDMESITPTQIAPLFIAARINPFDSPRYFDDIEIPGSAPSVLRSPFDIPYEPFEEKPNLKWDSFDQEFTNEMLLELRQDLHVRENRIPNSRVRRLSGNNHFLLSLSFFYIYPLWVNNRKQKRICVVEVILEIELFLDKQLNLFIIDKRLIYF